MQSIIDTMITRLIKDCNIDIEILQIAHETNTIKEARDIITAARAEAGIRKLAIVKMLKESALEIRPVFLETNGIWDTQPSLVGHSVDGKITVYYSETSIISCQITNITNVRFATRKDNMSLLECVSYLIPA